MCANKLHPINVDIYSKFIKFLCADPPAPSRQSQKDHEAHVAALGKEEAEMEEVRIKCTEIMF